MSSVMQEFFWGEKAELFDKYTRINEQLKWMTEEYAEDYLGNVVSDEEYQDLLFFLLKKILDETAFIDFSL